MLLRREFLLLRTNRFVSTVCLVETYRSSNFYVLYSYKAVMYPFFFFGCVVKLYSEWLIIGSAMEMLAGDWGKHKKVISPFPNSVVIEESTNS